MLFNTDKCKVMNLGNKNLCVKYELGGRELESILEEKNLGVLITKDLKVVRSAPERPRQQIESLV